MTAVLGRFYHHFLLHGAGLGSVVVHLRTGIKQKKKKGPDYFKSLRSTASARSPSRVAAAQQPERNWSSCVWEEKGSGGEAGRGMRGSTATIC